MDVEKEHQGRQGQLLKIATRKSPLALAQAELVAASLRAALGVRTEFVCVVTTGDRQADWSLEKRGGKGLFTVELEESLRRKEADLAVHSAKDLPGDHAADLALAGYLPRADARDVLVRRVGVDEPRTVATGSPRRRLQIAALFPRAEYVEIRGNVDTRLRKIAEGRADATVLAAAGLARLGIAAWPGLVFRLLEVSQMVPAVGQAAIGVQCRAADGARYRGLFDERTARTVGLERAFQRALGAGCQTAFAAHAAADTLHFFHETTGRRTIPLAAAAFDAPDAAARRILGELGFAAFRAPPTPGT
ncbi:MAG: hydroxymethylbilane synthase [Opitutaceae bacterium]